MGAFHDPLDQTYELDDRDRHERYEEHERDEARYVAGLDRRDEFRGPDPKLAAAVKRKDAPKPTEDDRWREEVFARDQGCVLHRNPAECSGAIEFHHVIEQKTLRKLGLEQALWRREIGICLCGTSHVRHTRAMERLPVSVLPTETILFVASLGLSHLIDRYYAPAPRLRTEAA